ncbi:MAG: hypothetical protein KatS3mg030_664 [Saprospiraceae bacterium]|nr:MAG: hypothetical protein KatS3mg030_664 [Saprospiraceae bacterium]
MNERNTPNSELPQSGNIFEIVGEKTAAFLKDERMWWNVFRRDITERIDEDLFSVLYDQEIGRPEAPVRLIVAMLILKEALGFSDEHLFELALYNLSFMISLGMLNLKDSLPSKQTYYHFCRRLRAYEQEHGRDLVAEQFERLTLDQIKRYKVDDSEVRLDPKVVSSNIRRLALYTLAVEALQVYFKSLSEEERNSIKGSTRRFLERLTAQTPEQHAYQKNSAQIRSGLSTLGNIIAYLLRFFEETRAGQYDSLERFFNENFEVKQSEKETPASAELPTRPGIETEQPEL